MRKHHKIEFDCECKTCEGTGLYVGCAEHDGVAVVCNNCRGTGKVHQVIEYYEFDGRKKKESVKRVLQCNPGISVGSNSELKLEDFGGMPYEDWLEGKPFPKKSEMRKFTCPVWWYQIVDYKRRPCFKDRCVMLGGSFSNCKYFSDKEKCWEMFDKGEGREG